MATKIKFSISVVLILITILVSCDQKKQQFKNQSVDFFSIDSVSISQINSFLDTNNVVLIDSSIFLNFKIGQTRSNVLRKLNKHITEGEISVGYENYDTLTHYYYKIPTRITNKSGNVSFKVDVKFQFNDNVLSQISLSLFAPYNWVPKNLKRINTSRSLAELETQLKSIDNSDQFNKEYNQQIESIEIIGLNYVSRLYNDVTQTYVAKYGNPIIENTNFQLQPATRISKESDLLWISKGRWISFKYSGTKIISEAYYFSNNSSKKSTEGQNIYFGTIYYTSVEEMSKRHKKIEVKTSKEFKDSITLIEQKKEKSRSEKLGI
jgi:hypothetical protein